jgi:membrane protein
MILGCIVVAFALVFGLLVLGPVLSDLVGEALNLEGAMGWLWWTLQWPIILAGLSATFATILYLGPNVDLPKFRFITPGSILAVVVWLAASGLFALYVGLFGSYNKTWGSLAAVIVMLTWLWLSGLALLLGAEVNAEAERSRRLRDSV